MKTRSRFILPMLGLSLVALPFAAGCAHEQATQAAAPAARAPAPVASAPPAPTPEYRGAAVSVSGDLVATCKIVFNSANQPDRAPKFDFDQSALPNQDKDVLDQVAKCVTTGPLRGRGLQLVGRADPRGEVEYNFALGEHRADSVGSYLSQLGVAKEKIARTSRGKLDATGIDEASWARDRRVDIALL